MENHPRNPSHPKQEVLRQHIDKMITNGMIETSTASRVSQVHLLIPKQGNFP
jgi:ribosomal protein L17